MAVAVVVAPLVALFLARTRLGKQMRAVADNRDLASVSGIDVERIGVYVWILAGGLAGLAGVMLGLSQGVFDPNMGLGPLFLIFTAVVLGGIGSAYGALVAGLVLGLAMELSTWDVLFGGLDSKYKPVLAFVVLILLLLYRPQGSLRPGAGALMEIFNLPFWIFVAVIAGIYTIFALGLYLQYALAGLPNFGHVAFAALAAYTMAILIIHLNVPMPVAALAGLLVAVLFGLVLGIPSLRLRADYLAIATVAGAEIVRYLALNMQGLTGGPIGSIGMLGPSQLAQYNQSWEALLRPIVAALKRNPVLAPAASRDFAMLLIVWVIALILLAVFWLMVRSPWGRMMRAIREDEDAAAAVGKNVFRAKLQVLILGALLGGLAGLLLAWQIGIITPDDYQPTFTFYAYLILILGGTTRIWAIPVGALLFGLLYSGTRFLNFYPLSLFDSGDRAYLRLILVGLLLILLMAIRPQGLLGNRRELLLR